MPPKFVGVFAFSVVVVALPLALSALALALLLVALLWSFAGMKSKLNWVCQHFRFWEVS
jgi:hypothetical protein